MAFCRENGIEYELCGKVIVATSPEELPRLDELYRRGTLNGVPGLEMIDTARLGEIEPEAAGLKALLSPNTGIIDYTQVTKAYASHLQKFGGEIVFNARLDAIEQRGDSTHLLTSAGEIETRHLINCAGLYADRVAEMMGMETDVRIIPFRGEYYLLKPEARRLVNGLIYPVPNPEFPFLGVHFTRSIQGGVEAGPNAVLALAREGYTKTAINPTESAWSLGYPGFWRMARKYWKTGLEEVYRSFSKKAFTQALQRLVPAIREGDLQPGGAGVRAQAVDRNGKLVDDFRIIEGKNAIHVLNAPSPGATASLAISAGIIEMAERSFGLERAPSRTRARSQRGAG
jgi:L-2-hydroxyglutarate oxidase